MTCTADESAAEVEDLLDSWMSTSTPGSLGLCSDFIPASDPLPTSTSPITNSACSSKALSSLPSPPPTPSLLLSPESSLSPTEDSRFKNAHCQISQLLSICGAPGIAYGIAHNGKLLYTNACGYRNVDKQLSPDSDTKFLIGSISKTFLSAAVSLAIQDGKMDLDAPLSQYLPSFSPHGDPRVRDVTIRQILSHTSGLGNPQILINGPNDTALQTEATCVDFANKISTASKRGERYGNWTYSNMGYGLVALALQNIYGYRYADLVDERILKPLDLHRTAVRKSQVWNRFNQAGAEEQMRAGTRVCGHWQSSALEGAEADESAHTGRQIHGTERSNAIFNQDTDRVGHSHGSKSEASDEGQSTDTNVALPYARLANGSYCSLISDSTTDEYRTNFLGPMGMRSSVSDLLKWGAAMSSRQPPPPLSTIVALIEDNNIWDQGSQQWYYHMGWARAQMPTTKLGVLSFNCRSMHPHPVLAFQPRPTPSLQTNGVMNGSTAAIYTFPNTQTVIVALANAASDGDAADWAAKILAQSLLRDDDHTPVDFLALAKVEAQARRAQYQDMLQEWNDGRAEHPRGSISLDDYIGVYKGLGTTLEISRPRDINVEERARDPSNDSAACASPLEDGQQNRGDQLRLVFNGVSESVQRLEWYDDDVLSFFPQSRDQWLGDMMFNWDFVDSGLLKFQRSSERRCEDSAAVTRIPGEFRCEAVTEHENSLSEASTSSTSSLSRVVSLRWAWDEAEEAGLFIKV